MIYSSKFKWVKSSYKAESKKKLFRPGLPPGLIYLFAFRKNRIKRFHGYEVKRNRNESALTARKGFIPLKGWVGIKTKFLFFCVSDVKRRTLRTGNY